MLVCTQGAAFEMDWCKFGVFQYRYYNITHISLSVCMHCMFWYGNSKVLERDVTTTPMAKAILRLKTLAFIPS